MNNLRSHLTWHLAIFRIVEVVTLVDLVRLHLCMYSSIDAVDVIGTVRYGFIQKGFKICYLLLLDRVIARRKYYARIFVVVIFQQIFSSFVAFYDLRATETETTTTNKRQNATEKKK